MTQIIYQNTKTGDAFDITTLVSAARWATKRTGSPASIELTVIKHKDIVWEHGSILSVKSNDTGIFFGYVFKLSESEEDDISVVAYDQTRYFKNKDTYVFQGVRADQITAQIAADFKIKIGRLENTGYIIPSMVEDGQTLFDIILKALDLTLINSNEMFYLWDDFGSLRISNVRDSKLDLFLGDSSLATGYTYSTDIDSETYNKIKLVKDNKKTGKRDAYVYQDSDNIRLWGILQDYEKVSEDMNEAQIKERGAMMLELYNRPKRSFNVNALSDLTVRAGRVLFIGISKVGISQFFIVEEADHDLLKETMSLKLKVM